MSEHRYSIDLESVRRAFPLHLDVPPLLLEFAAWLEGRPWGSVGCFELAGQFSEQAPVVDAALLRNEFALFLHLPEGSAVGAWCQPNVAPEEAPIVVLGSEGQHEILAPSLAALLARIASRDFDNDDWQDFSPHEDVEDATPQLADWLRARAVPIDDQRLVEVTPRTSDFDRYMETWCSDREEHWARHPLMAELARLLGAHRPAGKNSWDSTSFEVAIVGAQYQVRVLRRGRQPLEEASAVEPVLRRLRDEMWREHPALGLWYSMRLSLAADGRILPAFDYEVRPMFGEAPADLAEARADLARAPRPDRWIPSWLAIR